VARFFFLLFLFFSATRFLFGGRLLAAAKFLSLLPGERGGERAGPYNV
jgi:hypothetical protein